MADANRENKRGGRSRAGVTADPPDVVVREPAWRRPPPQSRRQMQPPPSAPSAGERLRRIRAGAGRAFRAIGRIRPNRSWLLSLLLIAAAVLAYRFSMSDQFYVYAAEVRGNERVSYEEIYEAAQIDAQHLLWVRPSTVAGLVAQVPGVASADVQVWPPNKVYITIEELTPLVAWQVGDKVTWIAADGRVTRQAGAPPLVTVQDAQGAASDGNGSIRSQVLADVAGLYTLRPDLTTVYYGAKEGLYFRAAEGWDVQLGNGGDMAAKLALLEALHDRLTTGKKRPSVVDLRTQGEAYLR